jgi:uncharacterized membrane protein
MAHEPSNKVSPPESARKHDHATLGATTLGGAAAGAAIGAIAGPAGVVAGGAIGTAVGALAGITMEREEVRRDGHDRDLDDAIGVTRGSLGAPEETKHPSHALVFDAEAEAARARGEDDG